MRKVFLIVPLLISLLTQCKIDSTSKKKGSLEKDTAQSENYVLVDDLGQYAEENDLIFFGVRNQEFKEGLDYYTLGKYSRYSFAEIFDEPIIAVKDKKRYKILKLDTSGIGQSSAISIKGLITFNNKQVIELIAEYQTSWSISNPIAGIFNECRKALILFDVENGKVIFSKVFKRHHEDTHIYDNYNIDSLYAGLYPDAIFEADTIERVYSYDWFYFYYIIKENTIEFYNVGADPREGCIQYTPEHKKAMIANFVTGKQPDFYYEFIKNSKRFIEN